jgi:hypothetical protein
MIRAVAKEKETVLLLVINFEQEKTAPYGAANQSGSAVAIESPHESPKELSVWQRTKKISRGWRKENEVFKQRSTGRI